MKKTYSKPTISKLDMSLEKPTLKPIISRVDVSLSGTSSKTARPESASQKSDPLEQSR
ncbi:MULTISPECIES: hypothetical protein [unclassified Mesorhizobium]|uniref:hypothetical protein n=1 Tax=unclassified Mesorhizobium TaxID=325217 RepID=UPI0013DF1907|nr:MULTISPECIES: hypothetical protein [unclassified Mesorhizobium]